MAIIWDGTGHIIRRAGVEIGRLDRADFGEIPNGSQAKNALDARLGARVERAFIHIERASPLDYTLLIAAPDSLRFAAASRLGLDWWEYPPAARSNPGGAR